MKGLTFSLTSNALKLIMLLGCSAPATPLWGQDVTPPTALSATYDIGLNALFVTFSEPMPFNAVSAVSDPFSYQSSVDINIVEITQADTAGTVFQLHLESSNPALISSELFVSGVYDFAGNLISPNPTRLSIQPIPEPSAVAIILVAWFLGLLCNRKRLLNAEVMKTGKA